jgi:glycosyltransferase involved in cell wall biosynthesis
MGKNKKTLPFVSVCTPTFNRRPFIPYTIKCFKSQDYPSDLIEWIIIDDGTDKVEDLVKDIPQVKYFYYNEKMTLGKKRNLMHEKASGDIIVYMDDDDYYPPERVSHAVNMLQSHPSALCAGASEIYVYFKHIDKMYQFGPYGPNHATAGTFAFKKELLNNHQYNDEAALAEEKAFLKDYTVPFVQLEPKKTILVFSHRHNTFDKKTLLDNGNNGENRFQKISEKIVSDFVKNDDMREFYMNTIELLLTDYKPGEPENKPDVMKQIEEIKVERQKKQEEMMKMNQGQISINKDGKLVPISNNQIVEIIQKQQQHIQELTQKIEEQNNALNNLSFVQDKSEPTAILKNDLEIEIQKLKKNEGTINRNVQKLISIIIEKDEIIESLKLKTA